ncbi:hypothetical protein LTS10_004803 [Elasticomyces elasticus]|nr:hypothetical protein LTS10_004803 [Elasticomyces elasticus]
MALSAAISINNVRNKAGRSLQQTELDNESARSIDEDVDVGTDDYVEEYNEQYDENKEEEMEDEEEVVWNADHFSVQEQPSREQRLNRTG